MAATTYRVCVLDLHKDSIFAYVRKGKCCTEVKKFETDTIGLEELFHWLHSERVNKVAMESTGIYWMPMWRAMEQDFTLILVNPYVNKQIPGRKSDVEDASGYLHCWIRTS